MNADNCFKKIEPQIYANEHELDITSATCCQQLAPVFMDRDPNCIRKLNVHNQPAVSRCKFISSQFFSSRIQ
jgi:hypothetical protein